MTSFAVQQLLDQYAVPRSVFQLWSPRLQNEYLHRAEICRTHCPTLGKKDGVSELDSTIFYEQIGNITVIRDDLLCGGTKSRFTYRILPQEYNEYVYVTPWYGSAQLALPIGVNLMNAMGVHSADGIPHTATMFCEPPGYFEPKRPQGLLSPLSSSSSLGTGPFSGVDGEVASPYAYMGHSLGDRYFYARDPYRAAENYVAQGRHALDRVLLPSGFNFPAMQQAIAEFGADLARHFGEFDECWTAVGSGTLIRSLQMARPRLARNFHGVCVFEACPDVGQAQTVVHDQPFKEAVPESDAPPYPSNIHYDAKVWSHVRSRLGTDKKVLLWNVL